jgi:hypothetical protein
MDFGQYLPSSITSGTAITAYYFDTVSGSERCGTWLDCINYKILATTADWHTIAPYKWFYLQGYNGASVIAYFRIDLVVYKCAKSINCVVKNMHSANYEIWYPQASNPVMPLNCQIDGYDGNPNCSPSPTIALNMQRYTPDC